MLKAEKRFDEILQSRWLSIALALLSVLATIVAFGTDAVDAVPGQNGLGLPSANTWFSSAKASLYVALFVYALTAVAIVIINRFYNLLHTLSLICGALFLWMLGACPMSMGQVHGGLLLLVILLAAITLMFSTFDNINDTPKIFLAFFLVTAGALSQYGFVPYLPILLMGCGQMRVYNFRTMLAAATGIVAPLWIGWGTGLVDFSAITKPSFDSIFNTFEATKLVWFLTLVGFTTILSITLIVANVIKIYSYNLITRARNGLLILTSIITIIMIAVDFTNMPFYFPLLCCCTAFQIGHFAHFHAGRRLCYISLGLIILVYAGFYLWRILL